MDIKGYLSRLFKTKELGMISLNDMAYIPTRNELNSELVESLDKYKEQYKEILLQDKYITSHDISSKDYSDDMIMNFYLFNRLIINQDEVYNLDTMEEYKRNELYLKYKINPYKILLYVDKMEEIYNETLLRLIALKEIINELELDKNKIDAIKNEIDALTTHYIIFKNNLYASLMEINNLKNNVNHQFDRYNEYSSNLLVKAYYNRLKKYYKVLMPDKFEEIDKLDLPLINKLANLERELEVYCYHSIDINKLNEELQEIDNIEKNIDNREYLLQRINELAFRYEVLNRYGGYELDLSPLYEVKFDILTIDINNQKDSPFKAIDNNRELKYYEDIILNKINTYVTGIDSILNNQLDVNDKEVIERFVKILKVNDGVNYELSYILMNKMILCLLLNVPYEDKMLDFFNNTIINRKLNKFFYSGQNYIIFPGINIDDNVPLSTLCRLKLMKEENKDISPKVGNLSNFARIYKYYASKEEVNDNQIYKVPEGIKLIVCANLGEDELEYLINKINGKRVIMPTTLKIFSPSNVFKNCSIPKIVFNEGFEDRIYLPFICNDLKSITIPSTTKMLAFDYNLLLQGKSYDTLEEFIFTNFEDSVFLNIINTNKEDDKEHYFYFKFFNKLFDMLNYDLSKFDGYKFQLIRDMKIILRDKYGYEYVINLTAIFYSLLDDNNRDVSKHKTSFVLEVARQIDEILLQYKEQKENRHKL